MPPVNSAASWRARMNSHRTHRYAADRAVGSRVSSSESTTTPTPTTGPPAPSTIAQRRCRPSHAVAVGGAPGCTHRRHHGAAVTHRSSPCPCRPRSSSEPSWPRVQLGDRFTHHGRGVWRRQVEGPDVPVPASRYPPGRGVALDSRRRSKGAATLGEGRMSGSGEAEVGNEETIRTTRRHGCVHTGGRASRRPHSRRRRVSSRC